MHAVGRFLERRPSGLATASPSLHREIVAHRQGAADERHGIDEAEHGIRVGERSASCRRGVAGRPGAAPALSGPTFAAPPAIERHEAAAAGADLGDVDRRQRARVAAALTSGCEMLMPPPTS
jgi:hypothetical protein